MGREVEDLYRCSMMNRERSDVNCWVFLCSFCCSREVFDLLFLVSKLAFFLKEMCFQG